MEPKDIEDLVNSKVKIYKKAQADKKPPEYNETYTQSVDNLERISIHSEIGKFPAKLLKKRAPNQTEEELKYIEGTYKNTTFPIWNRFIGFVNRIWNDQNWSIKWPEQLPSTGKEETPQDYLTKDYPVFKSLESYYKSIVTPVKQKDAMAVIAHKPYYLPAKMNEQGELVIDDSELIKPIACIYEASQVIEFKESEYVLIELKEKSWVQWGQGEEKTGLVYEFYDQENIWRIQQKGKKIDYKFDYFIYYNHNLGYLPVDRLKGIPEQKETDVLWMSPFMAAIDTMDDITLDDSYLRIIKAGHAFPHKWEYYHDCEYTNETSSCINGKVIVDGKDVICPSCQGTGRSKAASPLGVHQVKAPNRSDDSSREMQIPPFGWVAPDPAIMEFLRKETEKNSEKALSILNLQSSTDVRGGEPALSRQIDREESFSTIAPISNQTFDLYNFSNKCLIEMRYGVGTDLPVITEPKNYSIRNEHELTEELSEAKKNGMPEIAIRKILQEYLITRFNSQEDTIKAVDITFYADRLICLSTMEISQKKLSGAVANWEDILHTSIYTFIAEAVVLDPKFFEKTLDEQKVILVEKAKTKEAEINPVKLNPDTVLANANA
jgi:hypothetical protein